MSTGNSDKKPNHSAFDERQRDGQEPLEEVGPGECQAETEKCEVKPGELEGQPGACQIEHDEEIQDAFPVEEIPIIMDPEDGLPRPADPDHDTPFAHPFTYDVVCIEDDREYVEVFEDELGEVFKSLGPDIAYSAKFLETAYIGTRARFLRHDSSHPAQRGLMTPRHSVKKEKVFLLAGMNVCLVQDIAVNCETEYSKQTSYVLVRPIRPRCKYYKRQKFAHDGIAKGEFGHFILFRNCTMRRSVGGAFMSLMNEVVYACDYRDPPDPVTVEKYLDKFDRKTLNERPDLTLVPMFGKEGDDIRLEENKK